MALSDVQICNLALDRIGEKQSIGSLTENSAVAQACSRNYQLSRDFLIASHAWRWATTHATLAPLSYTRSGYVFAYALPGACVKPLYVWSGLRPGQSLVFPGGVFGPGGCYVVAWAASPPVPFETQLSDDGASQILLTDMEDAELVYVSSVIAPGLFPPLFTEALAWKLASDLALALPNKRAAFKDAYAAFGQAKLEAMADDLRNAKEDPEPVSRFITARYRRR